MNALSGPKAYKFRIYPNSEQKEQIDVSMRACVKVWNLGLELSEAFYELHRNDPRSDIRLRDGQVVDMTYAHSVLHREGQKQSLSWYDLKKVLTVWKKHIPWLYKAPSSALQRVMFNLDLAYKNAFRRLKQGEDPGFPKFKKMRYGSSYYMSACGRKDHDGKVIVSTQSVRVIDEHHILLPKLGSVKCRGMQQDLVDGNCGHVLSATVSKTSSGKYYVSVGCEDAPYHEMQDGVVDVMGVRVGNSGMTRSDGLEIENPKAYKKLERKLRREQRRLSRKVGAKKGEKPSANYLKQLKRKARVEERIADMRSTHIHEATKQIVRDSKAIAVGRPKVKQMTEKVKGEGRSVQRKKNRSTLDAAIYMTTWRLEYKAKMYGRDFVALEAGLPWTRTCNRCGLETGPTEAGVKKWTCPECGTEHDTAMNAAMNIAVRGSIELARS